MAEPRALRRRSIRTATFGALWLLSVHCDSRQIMAVDARLDAQDAAASDAPLHNVQTSCVEALRTGSSGQPCRFATAAGCSVRDGCCAGRVSCVNDVTIREPIACIAERSTTCAGAAFDLTLAAAPAAATFSRAWLSLGIGFDRHLTLVLADGPTLSTCATPRLSITAPFFVGAHETLALFADGQAHHIAPATLTIAEEDAAGDPLQAIHVSGSFSVPSWNVASTRFALTDCAELRTSGS